MVNNIISKAPTREEYEKLLKTIRLGEAPGETKQTIERLEQLITVPANKSCRSIKRIVSSWIFATFNIIIQN